MAEWQTCQVESLVSFDVRIRVPLAVPLSKTRWATGFSTIGSVSGIYDRADRFVPHSVMSGECSE